MEYIFGVFVSIQLMLQKFVQKLVPLRKKKKSFSASESEYEPEDFEDFETSSSGRFVLESEIWVMCLS